MINSLTYISNTLTHAHTQDEIATELRDAARSATAEMEVAFAGYTDAVKTESDRWKDVAERVESSEKKLAELRERITKL
jgi:hypothetical protein